MASDDAWRRVTPFREADAARVHFLNREECRRLVNASPVASRMIVRGALLSGARYSELARMHVADFHRDSGTVLVRTSKSRKVRHTELTAKRVSFFNEITTGRLGNELPFNRNGVPWGKSHQQRPLVDACRIAKITPAVSFHALRHTYASLMVMDAVPLTVVARNLGHADTRMVEKHYGHLATSYVRDVGVGGHRDYRGNRNDAARMCDCGWPDPEFRLFRCIDCGANESKTGYSHRSIMSLTNDLWE